MISMLPAYKQFRRIKFIAVILFLLTSSGSLLAAVTTEKTPNDVYQQVQLLVDDVHELRKENNIKAAWPHVKVDAGREPRHVFQKALEILGKIDSYRVNILKIGSITVPRFPGRDISPNEVYSVVLRLRQELNLLLETPQRKKVKRKKIETTNKTPSDVYAALSEVSVALEETLGLRGITPSEVYARSLQVVELVTFLRRSQNLPMDVPKPTRTRGKLPNHALEAVLELQSKIHVAEKNLWMKALKVPELPRRVISPSDVYDAMGVAIAELQSIQFRLGTEREFAEPELQYRKTSDDVILNTLWAVALLPEFELGKVLQQYDRQALVKTPNDGFSVTEHILEEIKLYRRIRGIKTPPRKVKIIPDLKPKHVYGKGLDVLHKVDILRRNQHMGAIAVPRNPLRTITPTEVFDLTLRLDEELTKVYETVGLKTSIWLTLTDVKKFEGKKPSDVFDNLQKISNLLDTIIGSEGPKPNDAYRKVLTIKGELQILARNLGVIIPASSWSTPKLKVVTKPNEVLTYTKEVLELVAMLKQRAGMFEEHNATVLLGGVVTRFDVFNQIRLIETELIELKFFLGITEIPELPPAQNNKIPGDVVQGMEGIASALRVILGIKGERL